jgi:V/A-type H+-transporting ATPase subunit D
MGEVSPTRTNLLARRSQARLARQGIDLLRRKREALIREFLPLAREFANSRKGMEEDLHKAYRRLIVARAVDGSEAVRSLAATVPPVASVVIEERRIWGIAVPKLKRSGSRPGHGGRDVAPTSVSARVIQSADGFQSVLDSLVDLASVEALVRRLGGEIRKANRRVNALEQVLLPRLEREMAEIRSALEEREREDKTRLKRIKTRSQGDPLSQPGVQGIGGPGGALR